MTQRTHETIHRVCGMINRVVDAIPETMGRVSPYIVRLIMFATCVAFSVLPFALIHHPEKTSFWYCLAAYGVYLVGVAQVLGRR